MGPDGIIYFGSLYGVVYAIQGSGHLAPTPWPKFRGDTVNSGRSTPSPAPQPKFERVGFSASGCTLKAQGAVGQKYFLQGSSDLRNWVTLTSVTAMSGTIEFNDEQAPGLAKRFYRLQIQTSEQ
jgi:hypothetical protein